MKNITSKIKFSFNEINSRLNDTEEKISELEMIGIKLFRINVWSLFDNIKLSDKHAVGLGIGSEYR